MTKVLAVQMVSLETGDRKGLKGKRKGHEVTKARKVPKDPSATLDHVAKTSKDQEVIVV